LATNTSFVSQESVVFKGGGVLLFLQEMASRLAVIKKNMFFMIVLFLAKIPPFGDF
jgi:hypothetical protein